MRFLRLIRSLVIIPIILLWTAVMAVVSLLLSLFDKNGRMQHGCARTWAEFILWISGVRVRVDNLGSVRGSGPFIFVSNHQSFFDIFSMLARLPGQFRFFAKDSLFRTPFIGWHLRRAGHLPIDRSNARSAYQSFQSAVQRIRAGTSVLIFPEGSRSVTGQIGSFRKGSLRLALTSGVPVIPIAIYGTRWILPKGSVLISPGRIDISIGEAIVPSEAALSDKANFAEMVRAQVVERYRKLEVERSEMSQKEGKVVRACDRL